jgi:ATP-dependent DNA helicase RecQ
VRLLQRQDPEELDIDFEALQFRKGYELEKLDQIMAYAGTRECRRIFLLRYFGETTCLNGCSACDVCLQPRRHSAPLAAAEPILAVKILSGIARLKGRFGKTMAAKVLTGSTDLTLLQFGLQRLSTYGLLAEYTQTQVLQWIQDLAAQGCVAAERLTKGKKVYPVLTLTGRGRKVMTGKEVLQLSLPPLKEKTVPTEEPLSHAGKREIFQRLRRLRARIAKQEGLPAYCIFQDRTLREMARILPRTPEQLLSVVGVGEVTLRKYGKQFLKLLGEIGQGFPDGHQ